MRTQSEVSRPVFRQLATRLTVTASWVAAFLLLFSVSMKAQIDTGRLTGTVKDSLGAVIVGAHITLTNHDTGVATAVGTTPTGTYVFEAISPGAYNLQATSSGFKTYSSDGVIIHLQQNATIDITLLPGSATEDVLVSAVAPLLQAADASLGQTIDEKTIDNMPLNGRNWTSLGQLRRGCHHFVGRQHQQRLLLGKRDQLSPERLPVEWHRQQPRNLSGWKRDQCVHQPPAGRA